MKDIQEEMAWAIERSIYIDGPVMQQCLNEASFECAEIADEQTQRFIDWAGKNGWRYTGINYSFWTHLSKEPLTTAQLLQKFKEESK